jgi:hypothetical protein
VDDQELLAELERVGVTYAAAGVRDYVLAVDLDDVVWFKGPPMSGGPGQAPGRSRSSGWRGYLTARGPKCSGKP